jgi:transcriptional regulator with XRE-family HTH domain
VPEERRPSRHAPAIGELIRQQRELAELSMRQLATMAGISNPYLSQIECGLRVPSDEVVEAIAESLQLSADLLRGRAKEAAESPIRQAVSTDPDLTASQRRSLLEAYDAFTRLNRSRHGKRRGT